MIFIGYLLFWAMLACIPALIAKNKGRDFVFWYLYGFLIFPVALINSLAISPSIEGLEQQALDNGKRKCPFCAEMVKFEAKICKHCGGQLPQAAKVLRHDREISWSDIRFAAVYILLPILLIAIGSKFFIN